MVHAPHTSERARPAGAASETSASLRKYAGHRVVVPPGLAGPRGGLVAASLRAEAFAALSAAASEEWEASSTGNQSMTSCSVSTLQQLIKSDGTLQPKRRTQAAGQTLKGVK